MTPLARALFIVLSVMVFVSIYTFAQASSEDFRPLTEKEKSIFYPMVCDGPAHYGNEHSCDEIKGNLAASSADGLSYITFTGIHYGSYSKAGAYEALVLFRSDLGGEVDRGMGAVLFEHEQGKWKLLRLEVSSIYSQCHVIPGKGQQKILCLDIPLMCCGDSMRSVKLIAGMNDPEDAILTSHEGRLGPHDDTEAFCNAGKAGKTLLLSIQQLNLSQEPGIFAETNVKYLTPDLIEEACNNEDIEKAVRFKSLDDKVRFVLDHDKITAILPKGLTTFSTY